MLIIRAFLVAALTMVLAKTAIPASDININVAVKTNGPDKPSRGSGGFWVDEGNYGRVSLTFPEDIDNFRVTSYGAKQGPVTRILGEEMYASSGNNEIALMSDLYLRPSVTAKGEIRLNGAMINMTRGGKSPLFDYSEQKIDFILAGDSHHLVKLSGSQSGKDIYLDISAKSNGDLIYTPKTIRYAELETEYSLFNESTQSFELQGCRASLGFSDSQEEGEGTISNRKFFRLSDKDSLLFISSFDMSNPEWNSDNSLTFDFDIVHIYAINPENTASFPNEIHGERTTIVTSSKRITISPGEKTEIEIPASKESLLPFKSKETIMLSHDFEEWR